MAIDVALTSARRLVVRAGAARALTARIAGALVVILGVVVITFVLTRVFIADPASLFVSPTADAAERARVREEMGLADPLWTQFGDFIGGLLRGDLGTSYLTNRPVTADLLDRLPATLELALYALIIGISVGLAVGVIAAVKENSIFDHAVRVITVSGLALPQFWLGLMLVWLFFVVLGWAPGPSGRLPIGVAAPPSITGFVVIDAGLTGQADTMFAAVRQLWLPVLTLSYGVFAPIARGARAAMILSLKSDYLRTARALGLSRPRIWFIYALKNAMLPVLTMLAGTIGWAFSGAVLVEGVFAWPGVGQYALNAMQSSDFPAVQGFVIYAAILYVIIYQLLDLAYISADPRIRT
ncbi:ABC transporter permease [Microbacterium trichothecenolyticum]|uniref:ABC transporter permease n=1 Tax=Microbacterium trichothecenolyticum TaxID=69370 RepID=UPI001C6EFE99|nr:ABC transporter permease [Microbacterium trichothecenolyticum]MBW9122081.1 ABC transporter permease [Microbacterium trichothecenolyticum]